jgi:hypothetical protein
MADRHNQRARSPLRCPERPIPERPTDEGALAAYQQQNGLQQTARLDRATMDRLALGPGAQTVAGAKPAAEPISSGSSTPPGGDVGMAPDANSANPAPDNTSR